MTYCATPAIVLPLSRYKGSAAASTELDLPDARKNIFARIIGRPTGSGRTPREIPCQEMLAGVLLNSRPFLHHFVEWLAGLTGSPFATRLENLEFEIHTEVHTREHKRVDLAILAHDEKSGEPILRWAVEIKVGAGFSESENDAEPQVVRYDRWLDEEQAEHKKGFVLALKRMDDEMPWDDLEEGRWHCTTWTTLGEVTERFLGDRNNETDERNLVSQLAGFIRKYLWKGEEMSDTRLTFEEAALLKAFAEVGEGLPQKVVGLVEAIEPILEAMPECFDEIDSAMDYFNDGTRCIVCRKFVKRRDDIWLCAGLTGRGFTFWLESSPDEHPRTKQLIREALEPIVSELQKQDSRWCQPDEAWEDGYWDLERTLTYETLLGIDGQQQAIIDFTNETVESLRKKGALGIVKNAAKQD